MNVLFLECVWLWRRPWHPILSAARLALLSGNGRTWTEQSRAGGEICTKTSAQNFALSLNSQMGFQLIFHGIRGKHTTRAWRNFCSFLNIILSIFCGSFSLSLSLKRISVTLLASQWAFIAISTYYWPWSNSARFFLDNTGPRPCCLKCRFLGVLSLNFWVSFLTWKPFSLLCVFAIAFYFYEIQRWSVVGSSIMEPLAVTSLRCPPLKGKREIRTAIGNDAVLYLVC